MKKYWHELSEEEQVENLKTLTVGELMDKYDQPDWCNYPEALRGRVGCWSLVGGYIKGSKSCEGCEEYKPKP